MSVTTQADWRLVRSRYDRYFGAAGNHWPRWWTDLDRRCQQMAANLMEDKELQHLIAASWRREAPSADGYARLAPMQREVADDVPDEQLADDEAAEADSLARQTMTGHERMLLAAGCDVRRPARERGGADGGRGLGAEPARERRLRPRVAQGAGRSRLAGAEWHVPDPIRLVRMVNEMVS